MFCETGKIQYESSKEASIQVAHLNTVKHKHSSKKHKHSFYKCSICVMFHTTTVTKRENKTTKR